MEIFTFFLLGSNIPFAIALTLMCAIFGLEVVSMLLGLSMSDTIDNALGFDHDVDMDIDVDLDVDVDIDVDMDMDIDADIHVPTSPNYDGFPDLEHGWLSSVLNWLHLGKVPVLILLSAFLLSFGLIGFFGQGIVASIFGAPVSAYLAGPIAFLAALPITSWFGKKFSKILPKIETSAIRTDSLVGKVGRITIGVASYDRPAEAQVIDQYGTSHYVRVAPLEEGEKIVSGTEVMLTEKEGNVFRVTKR